MYTACLQQLLLNVGSVYVLCVSLLSITFLFVVVVTTVPI